MRQFISVFIAVCFALTGLSCSQANAQNAEIAALRDSLDAIQYDLPKIPKMKCPKKVITIRTQEQWDNLSNNIKETLRQGCKNIYVKVISKTLLYGEMLQGLEGLNYPDVNIIIRANKTTMIPAGPSFSRTYSDKDGFYSRSYTEFDINDVLLDENNNPISLYGDCFQINTPIEEVTSEGMEDVKNNDGTLYKSIVKVWRFKTDLPNMTELECKDFYILLTRHWTSLRHRVKKVENGYLYFYLKSDEAPSLIQMTMDPNSDMKSYKTYPRCRLFNSPVSTGVHVKGGYIYIPNSIKRVIIGKGARLISIVNSKLNSFELSGFNVVGAGNLSCVFVYGSIFTNQCWVRDNSFANMSGSAVLVQNSENVCIYNNRIRFTRRNALSCSGKRVTIWKNALKDIGIMYNTMAISFGGTVVHVLENVVEDFNYSGIACGGTSNNDNAPELTYIVERNVIRHSDDFSKHYLEHTMADGGGIYVGPQNSRGIIRNNVVQDIIGIHSNRGIFLDDGAKNLVIYGNFISGTVNSYDIDLRYCTTYRIGIPDHNTNNIIIQNVMTGTYRFEEGENSKSCIVGDNVLLNGGKQNSPSKVSIKRKASDRKEISHAFKIDEFVKKYMLL